MTNCLRLQPSTKIAMWGWVLGCGLTLVGVSPPAYPEQPTSPPLVTVQWSNKQTDTKPVISLGDTYSYQPSAWATDGNKDWDIWFCGGGSSGDRIFYTTMNPVNKSSIEPVAILEPENNDLAADGQHACAPSVVEVAANGAEGQLTKYLLYYECASRIYDRGHGGRRVESFTQICLALSKDGTTWTRYSSGSTKAGPTPIIKASAKILENCEYIMSDDKYSIDTQRPSCGLKDFINNYGVGHPAAIVMKTDDRASVWLYYYDSAGDWSKRGVYLVKSADGIHFGPAIKTDLQNASHIKYYPEALGPWKHAFVATTVIGGKNSLMISEDGMHWEASITNVGNVAKGMCAAPGPGDIVSNNRNNIFSLSVNLLVAEGALGRADRGSELGCYDPAEDRSRGSTWHIYLLQGRITGITVPPQR